MVTNNFPMADAAAEFNDLAVAVKAAAKRVHEAHLEKDRAQAELDKLYPLYEVAKEKLIADAKAEDTRWKRW